VSSEFFIDIILPAAL